MQKPGSAASNRYESKPPPPLPQHQQHQQNARPHQNSDPRRLQANSYGHPASSPMSPPPQAQGPRPTTHNRPPAASRPPPSPAPQDGTDPTLLPLFRAVDKDSKLDPKLSLPFRRVLARTWLNVTCPQSKENFLAKQYQTNMTCFQVLASYPRRSSAPRWSTATGRHLTRTRCA